MGKEILKIEDLHYTYISGDTVLNGVNIFINEGEKIAFIGANGSGKSTFFLNINGVLTPDSGKITYLGTEITRKNLKELRKNIGIVFQDADNQIIASTVRSEVGFGPLNLKLSKEEVEKRVNEALEYMNITDLINKPPHYLSGGEKKRVSIADIIAMKPQIIIFDEPTASLDPLNSEMLEDVLERLSSENKTILISIHDVDFVYRFASRVVVFYKGEIIADGTPLEIFKNKEVLEKSNLKQPVLLETYEMLVEKGLVDDLKLYPKTTEELKNIL